MSEALFSTNVLTGLLNIMIASNYHYFLVGVFVLACYGFYYHHTLHEGESNTLVGVHGFHLDRVSILISRFFLGGVFLIVGGLHGIFNFVPTDTNLSSEAQLVVDGLPATGYLFPAVKTIELLLGVAFLFGLYMPLTLVVSAPIVFNIGLYHLFLDHSGLPIAILMGVAVLYLTHRYRTHFRPLFTNHPVVSDFKIKIVFNRCFNPIF